MSNAASSLEFALLGLIQQKPQSGYDLRKTFATTAMRHYSDSPGSIYPALKRLVARGWIEEDDAASGRPDLPRRRQVFRLTETGKSTLVHWIEQPVGKQDVMMRMAEIMLRFAFMDGNVPRVIAIRFLEQFEQELIVYVAELRANYEQMNSLYPLHTGVLAFQSGIEGMEAQIIWARQARARLKENSQ
jgi:DNA-binding PadR family transcriptional regulator